MKSRIRAAPLLIASLALEWKKCDDAELVVDFSDAHIYSSDDTVEVAFEASIEGNKLIGRYFVVNHAAESALLLDRRAGCLHVRGEGEFDACQDSWIDVEVDSPANGLLILRRAIRLLREDRPDSEAMGRILKPGATLTGTFWVDIPVAQTVPDSIGELHSQDLIAIDHVQFQVGYIPAFYSYLRDPSRESDWQTADGVPAWSVSPHSWPNQLLARSNVVSLKTSALRFENLTRYNSVVWRGVREATWRGRFIPDTAQPSRE